LGGGKNGWCGERGPCLVGPASWYFGLREAEGLSLRERWVIATETN
jgi:hypothetical protein